MARSRDLHAQQQRLSAATWAVLAADGLTGLTVRAVAERAGCTTGLVMHAFGDKRALLRHARQLLHDRTAARADQAEAAAADPESRLWAVLMQAATLGEDSQEEARVWIAYTAAAVADPGLAGLHVAHNRAFVARLGRLLAGARPDLAEDARSDAAVALAALVEGLNTLAALDPATYDTRRQARAIDEALGRLPGPGAARRAPGEPRHRPG
jgi:TetR/AcrR family transcriptional regulator, transcriptional repressor of bet genes